MIILNMANLLKLSDLDFENKKVIVRGDLDVNPDDTHTDRRLTVLAPTLQYLIDKKAKVILIGHRGRPEGKVDESLSLKPVSTKLSELLGKEIVFLKDLNDVSDAEIVCLENLRFDPGEEANDSEFAKKLASLGDLYVNEAFSVSHRQHASIVGIPKLLPHAMGLNLESELENLDKLKNNPKRPLIVLISGVKKDKVAMIEKLKPLADKILVGGRLPDYMGDNTISVRMIPETEKVVVGNLVMDKEDITIHTIERFKDEIKKAGSIVLAGVLGKYEDEGHRQGTKEIFEAVAATPAFKVVGGGDSLTAVEMFGLTDKFDWVSVGGGAMLEYLVADSLPGTEALK
jgi:3-phosphoglycerate kinase